MPALQRRGSKRCTPAPPAAARSRRAAAGGRLPLPAPHRARAAVPRRRADPPAARRPPCARWRRRWACRPANSRTRWPRTAPSSRGLSATCSAWSAWATPRSLRRPPMRPTRKNPTNSARWPDRSAGLRRRGRRPAAARRHLMGSHRVRSLPDASRRRVERCCRPPCAPRADARAAAGGGAAVRPDRDHRPAQRLPGPAGRISRHAGARGAHGGRQPLGRAVPDQHPLLLDSLIDWRTLFEPLDFGQIARQLAADLDACRLPDGDPDIERQMNLMRDVQRQASFQLLAQDLEGELTVESWRTSCPPWPTCCWPKPSAASGRW